ncbi:MAG: ABC transporter ATP-binding protein [Gammaproteobacteria bacterium]|nr:ABC transporter ATP-binding protein [Gammaproteobacteria bacterium]
MSAITVRGIHKSFRNLHALKGVDLDIRRGEFFGLLGPNGAGKSTLINIIAGLARADRGSVSVLGHDVADQYREARRCLGIVPQEIVFDPFFNVREVLRLQAGYFGLGRGADDWIDELLSGLGLADKAGSNMRSLSGGMKRRVLVAQALVHKPEVVVLDEPTAGVDVELRQSLWAFVRRLHAQGRTIVLTTHYLEEAESLCDRIAILNHGELVALDTKQGLLDKGVGKTMTVCVTLATPMTRLPEDLQPMLKEHKDNRLLFQIDRSRHSIVQVFDSLRRCGAEILDLETEAADLEDVFIELTTRSR